MYHVEPAILIPIVALFLRIDVSENTRFVSHISVDHRFNLPSEPRI